MSFEAVNWAWKQKSLKPFQKLILVALADRHNPDHGCFPSINTIIEDTGISRSSVLRTLGQLQDIGLIRKQAAFRDNKSQTSNRYIFAFEGVSESDPPHVTLTPLSVSERHPKEPLSNKPISLKQKFLFTAVWETYPRKVGKGAAMKAWLKAVKKISEKDLLDAINAYIESIQGKDKQYIPHLSTWLNQERWMDELEVTQTSTEYLKSLFSSDGKTLDNQLQELTVRNDEV
tara:strand:+ start:462 stop:1154 length:693 start_codon:yes stop_codon:yes gene_type:complete